MRSTWLFVSLGSAEAFAQEVCTNAADDDGDALVDCADADCGLDATCCAGGATEEDGDGWCDGLDVCVLVADPTQADADVDGAGDACDVCPTQTGDGLSGFGAYRVLATPADFPTSVYATDLDGDGDGDVLFTANGGVAWIENLGGGTFGPYRVLATLSTGSYADSRSVYATDLAGDGDPDVLAVSYYDNDVAWVENLGGGAFAPVQVITGLGLGPQAVYATDLDGDADVLSASFSDSKLAWMETLGGGAFGPSG